MVWLFDVLRARELVRRGKFKAVTHGGTAHADDTIAAAILYRNGAEEIYRLNTAEEILGVGGDVIVVDIGDSLALPPRYVVLDHHGISDPSEEPSTVIQTALAVELKPSPLVATLLHHVDLFDRFGPTVKMWAGPFGQSLNNGLTRYFGEFHGLVKDEKFLSLVGDAVYSKAEYDISSFAEAFKLAEKIPSADLAEKFPRTFASLRLMLKAARDPWGAALSQEAFETGFGVDFGCYALMVVPELEQYVARGLERYFSDARKAAEIAAAGRYAVINRNGLYAIVLEDLVPPGPLWNAVQDLGHAPPGPAFIAVKDRRNPGAYTLWRPDKYAKEIDFRKLSGHPLLFKHASGFMAVVKATSAQEAAEWALAQL